MCDYHILSDNEKPLWAATEGLVELRGCDYFVFESYTGSANVGDKMPSDWKILGPANYAARALAYEPQLQLQSASAR
jgi:hypothetical protein